MSQNTVETALLEPDVRPLRRVHNRMGRLRPDANQDNQDNAVGGDVPASARRAPFYPTRDGKPMAETVEHRANMNYTFYAAQFCTIHILRKWVSSNDFVYYVEGDPRKRFSPDVYVVLDVPKKRRPYFKIWEEGKAPDVIWEFTSKGTKEEDTVKKYELYEQLGVREYILFDPLDEYLKPRLQGYRLVEGKYEPIELDEQGRLHSAITGMVMYPEGHLLRCIHPRTGEVIRTWDELEAYNQQVIHRAREEEAQASLERLRAEREAKAAAEERLRADQERARAEQERARAEQERARAEQEAARATQEALIAAEERERANSAEAELAQLRVDLARLRGA